jgi:hypothetical protein
VVKVVGGHRLPCFVEQAKRTLHELECFVNCLDLFALAYCYGADTGGHSLCPVPGCQLKSVSLVDKSAICPNKRRGCNKNYYTFANGLGLISFQIEASPVILRIGKVHGYEVG